MSENHAPAFAGHAALAVGGDDPELRETEAADQHPAPPGVTPSTPSALPQRISSLPAPAIQGRMGPLISIEILQRVIDGLSRL
jgi:hypothetical protein